MTVDQFFHVEPKIGIAIIGEGKFIPQGNSCEVITFPVGEPLKNLCARFLENIISGNYTSISDGLVGTDLVRVLQALTLSLETDEKKIYVQEVS